TRREWQHGVALATALKTNNASGLGRTVSKRFSDCQRFQAIVGRQMGGQLPACHSQDEVMP
ncbi:MAG: hypothetical protein Q4A11_05420, partial [Brachymonas sp.]|nr:hypothetical protein [Brachymonas sp.]